MALLLFDIDGTLLRGGDPTHANAFDAACRAIFGVPCDVHRTDLAGRTDRHILRAVLALEGVTPNDAQINQTFGFMEDYVERELTHSLENRLLPGVRELLMELRGHTRGLVTGNLPRIAKVKLSRAGIWSSFDGVGGFGHLSEVRADLVRAALEQSKEPADRTVVIGDTLHDIECGRAHGTRTVGVATGRVPAEELQAAGADLVLGTLDERDRFLQFVGELS